MRVLGDLEPREAEGVGKDTSKGWRESVDVKSNPADGNADTVGEVPLRDRGGHVGGAPMFRQIGDSWRYSDRQTTAEPPAWTRDSRSRRHPLGALWCAFAVLTLVLIGELAYTYHTLHKGNISISQIPEMLQSVTTLTGRMQALETKLPDLETKWDSVADAVIRADRKVDATLKTARRQTQELVAQAEARLRDQMNRQAKAVDARLSQVESNQREDHTRLAQLNDQLEKEVTSLRADLAANQDGTNRGLASLHQEVSQNEEGLHNLAQQIHRERVTFEMAENTPTEIVPGISLTVLKTNPRYQRFRGYVSLTAEGRTLWLDDLGAQESLDLYPHDTSHPYSLVITRVNPSGVTGYLLLPAGTQGG